MGGSESKSTSINDVETNISNVNNMNILNEQVNQVVTNNLVNQAQSCTANTMNINEMICDNLDLSGNARLEQSNKSAVDFNCIQESTIENQVRSDMLAQIMEKLETSVDSGVLQKLEAAAESAATTGAFAPGKANSQSFAQNTSKVNIKNTSNKNIQNILKNQIVNNFSATDTKKCMTETINSNKFKGRNCNIGDNAVFSQANASEVVQNCVQRTGTASSIIAKAAMDIGLDVKDTAKTKAEQAASAESKSTATVKGPLDLISDLFNGLFAGLFSGPFLIVIVVVVVVFFVLDPLGLKGEE